MPKRESIESAEEAAERAAVLSEMDRQFSEMSHEQKEAILPRLALALAGTLGSAGQTKVNQVLSGSGFKLENSDLVKGKE